MKYPFLLSPPDCLHSPHDQDPTSGSGGPPLNRRLFLKRSGGASVAAIMASMTVRQQLCAQTPSEPLPTDPVEEPDPSLLPDLDEPRESCFHTVTQYVFRYDSQYYHHGVNQCQAENCGWEEEVTIPINPGMA